MSTTPAERKALLFLGAVALLGVGTRVVGAMRGERPATEAAQPGLERQLARAERAAAEERAKRSAKERAPAGTRRGGRRRSSNDSATTLGPPAPPAIVDIDTADTLAIATLPGVGPALARRIVEDRAARGAFGGAAALDAVRGVGPALLARVASRVTFSGPPRPPIGKGAPAHTGGRRRRRGR